jgi:hypothetical protein
VLSDDEDKQPSKKKKQPMRAYAPAPNLCTFDNHCGGCAMLPYSRNLLGNELVDHGCCGQDDCKAVPRNPADDMLSQILLRDDVRNAVNIKTGENNSASHCYAAYVAWTKHARAHNIQSPRFVVNDKGISRDRLSCCVLHKIRACFFDPNRALTGYVAPE